MKAMVLKNISDVEDRPLKLQEIGTPKFVKKQILVKVSTCGICHTEIDEVEGRMPPSKLPMVLGHQIVGVVEALGPNAKRFKVGDRVGIAWIYNSCGKCYYCKDGKENLCDNFQATGRDANGGYGEFTAISEDFAYSIPDKFSDLEAAPLLCAGAIGYRSLRLTEMTNNETLGLFGFGASGHLIIQIVKHKYPDAKVFVFTRNHQEEHQKLAERLGADWVGIIGSKPPELLDCAIDTTPAWNPVIEALGVLKKGGQLVINAIRKDDKDKGSLLKLDYAEHLWWEKKIKSVANITRKDTEEFLQLAAEIKISPEVQKFSLEEANRALMFLKKGKIKGAGVLKI